ncbi:M20 metallopeptidase family protein [Lachnospiraceae bacterium LCP25S3_G4]
MELQLTKEQQEKMVLIKSKLHEYPELSWKEYQTAALIRKELSMLEGIEFIETSLDTAVVARIRGNGSGKTIALRADMDAIQGEERWESKSVSKREGVAHLCGHDFHTAALLGAAMILGDMRGKINGDVVFLFQPAEETTTGARRLVEEGILKKCQVDAIFGLHNRPEIPTGQVVVKKGPLMAAKNNFRIVVNGIGGHGSMPHKCVDPIVCAAAIIQSVQTINSRNIDPMEAIVLSICSVHGGTFDNLIVDKIEMTGSMRTFQSNVEERALKRLHTMVEQLAAAYECTATLSIEESVPAVANPESMYELALAAAKKVVGEKHIVETKGCLATEDFACYMQEVPGFFYWLGVGKQGEPHYSWHNDKFHTDDQALHYGAKLLAQSAIEALR